MSVIVLLLAASLLLGTTFLIFFIRAVRAGQFADTTTPAMRVLADDEPRPLSNDWKKPVRKVPAAGTDGQAIELRE